MSEGRPLSKLNSLKASPVLLSVWNNDPRMLSMLLESGADGSSIDRKSGFAPLHHAAMCEGAAECIKVNSYSLADDDSHLTVVGTSWC